MTFSEAKNRFDDIIGRATMLRSSLVPAHGETKSDVAIRGIDGRPLEEYYKWQFIYALTYSGLFPKDNLGVEVHFPKGNVGASDLIVDAAIFDSPEWLENYRRFWNNRSSDALQWLND